MVNIEDIGVKELHNKLKNKQIGRLVREVFGKDVNIDECIGNLFLSEEENKWKPGLDPKCFLVIFPNKNKFILKDEKYSDKTREFAEKYEQLFGTETNEITIKLAYFK